VLALTVPSWFAACELDLRPLQLVYICCLEVTDNTTGDIGSGKTTPFCIVMLRI
jgi:hypothetical protein